MQKVLSSDSIGSFFHQYRIETAASDDLVEHPYRFRRQLYCLEQSFLPDEDDADPDEFDQFSHHTLLVDRRSGDVSGSARLILGSRLHAPTRFPMQAFCRRAMPPILDTRTTAELSRFAISRGRGNAPSTTLMRLALIRGLVALSAQFGITHWCAVMEPSLLRLLQATSIVFKTFGPPVQYHGLRQPCYGSVADILDRVAQTRPQLWQFLTAGGTLLAPRRQHS